MTFRARPTTRIIALECRCSSEQFSLALKAGADGFLNREAGAADVVSALRTVRAGQTYVSPAIVTKMVNTYVLRTDPGYLEDPYDSLSDREREVLLLAAGGHTNREIARATGLSDSNVGVILFRAIRKLRVQLGAPSNVPVLLLGEGGGFSLVAMAEPRRRCGRSMPRSTAWLLMRSVAVRCL